MSSTFALWTSIILGGVAQILLKRGLNERSAQASNSGLDWWKSLLTSLWIWAWGISFVVATALWLLAVSQMNISYAFPLLSASYALVALLSRIFLKERVDWRRWGAIAVICVGVILIAAR